MVYHESHNEFPQRVVFFDGDQVVTNSGTIEIVKTIGKGGFGSVYLAKQENGKEYALKLLNLWECIPTEYEQLTKRFSLEYKIGKIDSAYLIKTYHLGFIEGNPYIVMEYCPNGHLAENLNKFKSDTDYFRFCSSMLSVMETLHDNQIIHRDIKPENILFTSDQVLKLIDFGIAGQQNNRLTSTTFFGKAKEAFASVIFSPPEQLNQKKYFDGTKSTMDIYAFGTTLYYLLSMGQMPFGGFEDYKEDPGAFIKRKERGEYTPLKYYNPNLNEFWYEFTEICMEENPDERFQTATEASEYLAQLNFNEASHSNPFFGESPTLEPGELYIEIKNEDKQQRVSLNQIIKEKDHAVVTIGRENTQGIRNDIELGASKKSIVSKRHATLEFVKNNWYIRDGQKVYSNHQEVWKHSLNGIYVNGDKLQRTAAVKIDVNDLVQVGNYTLKIIRRT